MAEDSDATVESVSSGPIERGFDDVDAGTLA